MKRTIRWLLTIGLAVAVVFEAGPITGIVVALIATRFELEDYEREANATVDET